ncbi:MAG: twitching motility protein, partial [Deltaproteobacteria bacterium]|nr:twitching motility protein [Deltaproteobacteria bacterium]
DLILHGETEENTFYDIMANSQAFGMMTFDQCIAEHYKNRLITEETALGYASHKAVVKREIDSIKAARGEKTTSIEGLEVDKEYGKTM